MKNVADEGIKVDFHIHSAYSVTKDSWDIIGNSNEQNLNTLIDKLNYNKIQMCAITDHDTFNYGIYKKLKAYENDESSSLLKILPGVEFSVTFKKENKEKQLHVIALFPDDNDEKIKNIENVLNLVNGKPDYDCVESFSEEKFIKILNKINMDVILIAHQKQTLTSKSKPRNNDANSLGEVVFNEFVTSEYFEAYEFKNKKNELFNNMSMLDYNNDVLRFITGSDCHDWSVYPKHDIKSKDDDFKFTFFKCLPTFRGVAFAVTDKTRISLENNFFTTDLNNYLKEISLNVNGKPYTISLSKGINAIIGDNSIGKSLLLHKITNYYRKEENSSTSPLTKKVANGYDNYLEKNNISIATSLDRSKIYEFDTQGEIRKKFNLSKIDSKTFYKNKFPSDVNADEAKKSCESRLEYICNYLKSKFDFEEEVAKISDLSFLKDDVDASSITYVNCINVFNKEIKEVSEILKYITNSKTQLENLLKLNIKQTEKDEINSMIQFLTEMRDEYSKVNSKLSEKLNVINIINTVFKDISDRKELINTTEATKLTTFINKKVEFEDTIANAYLSKYDEFKEINIENAIDINPNEYPYLSYKFVKRTLINRVDNTYLENLLCSPMRKGFKIDEFAQIDKQYFIENLLRYDGDSSCIEFYKQKVQDKINNDFKSEAAIVKENDKSEISYSDGINSQIYFDIICGDKYANGIYLIDQPEDDVSPSSIKKYLLSDFKKMSKNRQIILVTHNPQFVVNLDADNIIALTKNETDNSIEINSGALEYFDENVNIINSVATILDGGIESLRKRWKRYEKEFIDK